MFNPPPKQALDQVPRLYANQNAETAADIIIHMHFFCGGCDWFVAEHKEHEGEQYFFGFVNLGDPINAEWGQFTLSQLSVIIPGAGDPVIDAETEELIGRMPVFVEWDENWQPKPFKEIKGPWQRYR